MNPLEVEQAEQLKDYFLHRFRIWNRDGKPQRAEVNSVKPGISGPRKMTKRKLQQDRQLYL